MAVTSSHLIILVIFPAALLDFGAVDVRRAHTTPTWTRLMGEGGITSHGGFFFCIINSRRDNLLFLRRIFLVCTVVLQRDMLHVTNIITLIRHIRELDNR